MNFAPLAVVVAAGLLGPFLASWHRYGPPVVVGEIAAGVIIGNEGFGWVDPHDTVLSGLAAIGFALLMFVVGTHLPVRDARLRPSLTRALALTATLGALAIAAGFGLAPFVGLHRPAVLAVLLATSSGAVALPVLQDLNQSDRSGVITMAWIAIADVVTVLAIPLVLATGRIIRVITGGLLVVVAGVLVLVGSRLALRSERVQRVRRLSRDRGWGLDLRVSLVALFTFAWLANRFGSSVLIAGFTVGIVVALLGEPRRVGLQLVGLGEGFAIPLFFVHLGSQIDLRELVRSREALALAGAVAGAAVAVHVLTAVVWRLPIAMGLVASAQLGVPSAIVSIGLGTRQLTAAQGAAVMAALLATLAACAVGATLLGHEGVLTDASAPFGPGSRLRRRGSTASRRR